MPDLDDDAALLRRVLGEGRMSRGRGRGPNVDWYISGHRVDRTGAAIMVALLDLARRCEAAEAERDALRAERGR